MSKQFEFCCNLKEIFSYGNVPCDECDRSCEHLSKVCYGRRILKKDREFILKRDGACLKCNTTKKLTIDHIVPICKGGSNEINNLQTLCLKCNSDKDDKIIDYRFKQKNPI